jgi:hypothetical protein
VGAHRSRWLQAGRVADSGLQHRSQQRERCSRWPSDILERLAAEAIRVGADGATSAVGTMVTRLASEFGAYVIGTQSHCRPPESARLRCAGVRRPRQTTSWKIRRSRSGFRGHRRRHSEAVRQLAPGRRKAGVRRGADRGPGPRTQVEMCPSAEPRVPRQQSSSQPHSQGGQLACHVSECSGACRLRARTERAAGVQAYIVPDPCRPRPQYSQA